MIQVGPKLQSKKSQPHNKKFTYLNIISYLNDHWREPIVSLTPFKNIILNINKEALKTPTIIIAGTCGKTPTSNFLTTLLKKEKVSVSTFTSPHFISYNEYITINGKNITNEAFTKHANNLLNTAVEKKHTLHSHELLMGILLLNAHEKKINLLVLEQQNLHGIDPIQLLSPKIIGITHLLPEQKDFKPLLKNITPTTFIIASEQNKINLQNLHLEVATKKAQWVMPVRKIAPLPYPHEQLHGKYATLAERIAFTYISNFIETKQCKDSLLNKPKKQRGRPTLEYKKQEELSPAQTVEQFWSKLSITIPGNFQILPKEKPTILLDCARSIESFEKLFLGIRLLTYKADIKQPIIIIGSYADAFDHETFIKQIRYFFKKSSGRIFFCPVTFEHKTNKKSWDPQQVCNIAKNIKINAEAFDSFEKAFTKAKQNNGNKDMIVIAGSPEIISEYWRYKKKS